MTPGPYPLGRVYFMKRSGARPRAGKTDGSCVFTRTALLVQYMGKIGWTGCHGS